MPPPTIVGVTVILDRARSTDASLGFVPSVSEMISSTCSPAKACARLRSRAVRGAEPGLVRLGAGSVHPDIALGPCHGTASLIGFTVIAWMSRRNRARMSCDPGRHRLCPALVQRPCIVVLRPPKPYRPPLAGCDHSLPALSSFRLSIWRTVICAASMPLQSANSASVDAVVVGRWIAPIRVVLRVHRRRDGMIMSPCFACPPLQLAGFRLPVEGRSRESPMSSRPPQATRLCAHVRSVADALINSRC